ncbi:DNA-binding protein [uncultured Methylophaga sp.]|uniref:DNA-binding protein n=1 Tax=uncultured Methylophaga sp. TaxID=285271 RepID=UPI002623586E|nr:DNA-binding protein [uncultured Methylophaga sp.]
MDTRRRREPVSKDQVFDFIEAYMQEHSVMPTQQLIIDKLGGSLTTIGKHVREWQQSAKNQVKSMIEMPEQIREASLKVGAQWWSIAEKMMSESIQVAQDSAAKAVEQANQNYHLYQNECEQLESLAERLQSDLDEALTALNHKNVEVSEMRERLIKAEQKNEHDADTIKRLNEEILRSKELQSEAVKQVTRIYEERLLAADAQFEKLTSKQQLSKL